MKKLKQTSRVEKAIKKIEDRYAIGHSILQIQPERRSQLMPVIEELFSSDDECVRGQMLVIVQ